MLDFQQKRKLRAILYHKVTLVILAILVIFSIHSIWQVYQKEQESAQLKEMAQNRVQELEAREGELNTDMGRLNTPEGVEAEIRSKFSVAKPNENIVLIVDDASSSDKATTTEKSMWQKFLDLF